MSLRGKTLDSEPQKVGPNKNFQVLGPKKAVKSAVANQVPENSEVKELRGQIHKLAAFKLKRAGY